MISPRVPIATEHTGQRQTQAIQANAAKIAKAVNGVRPGMVTVKDQLFVVDTNTYVAHGLGRVPVGYAMINIRPHPTLTATGSQSAQRNTTTDPNNNEAKTLSLGPWQPFLADVEVW